ncbi:hypothetical protein EPN87_03895 [archaeon]|nr:MAG: hypothetical protein EPN87_03895 [archaeon]
MGKHAWHVAHGVIAGSLLLALYFGIVGALQGMDYAISRFAQLWYLMVPLVVSFGFQVSLFSCIRSSMKSAAMFGGVSTASMVACCAHHITDVVPLLGVTAVGLLLVQYQASFLVLGLVSNVIGILMVLNIAKKSRVKFKSKFFKSVVKQDLGSILKIVAIAGVAIVALSFIFANPPAESSTQLEQLSNTQNAVTFSVQPVQVSASKPVEFEIVMDTHSVVLDFDITQVSTLTVDGKEMSPTEWRGSVPGGHHRSGILVFPVLDSMPSNLKLVIIAAGATRVFEWHL